MDIKELINKSYYGTQGYIGSIEDLEKLEIYVNTNAKVINEYKNVIVATNFSSYDEGLQKRNADLWHKYFPNAIMLDSPVNRGHNHGYCDLENLLVEYCIDNDIEWLCKSANDTLLTEDIWDLPLPDEEFDCYYQLQFNQETIHMYKLDGDEMKNDWSNIQGAFYFINTSKVTSWHNHDFLDSTYEHLKTIDGYDMQHGKIWEHIPEFECELMIAAVVERNKLSKHYMYDGELYFNLWKLVYEKGVNDPSHKNIMIQGICHLHFLEHEIAAIKLSPPKPKEMQLNITKPVKGTFSIN